MTKNKTIYGKVLNTISTQSLIDNNDKVLVALSGGADSVALLHILIKAGINCEAAHCNFHLRGDESDCDEKFVRSLCKRMNVKLHTIDFETAKYAHNQGISIEMAARDLRYDFFERLRKENNFDKIAVAHHRNDNVETMLLNLIRGTGLRGLTGIHYKNGYIIRPLLDISREEIEDYLAEIGADFVTDSTNLVTDTTRNVIRLEILPQLKSINPSVMDTLQATISRLNESYDLYQFAINRIKANLMIDNRIIIKTLKSIPSAKTVLHELLSDYGFNNSQTTDIIENLDCEIGKVFESNEWRLLRDREALILKRKDEKYTCLCDVLPLDGYIKVTNNVTFFIERVSLNENFNIPRSKDTVCLDLDKLEYPLTVRLINEGDRFVPFGMNGEKLISDYLTDKKKTLYEKEAQLVVCSGDNIAWLVNERPDNRFRITVETKRVLIIKCINY